MLDSYLADLYDVETKTLNRAARRNIDRFPDDFMFELTEEEFEILRYQIGTLRSEHGQHRKYLPLVFTEQGIAMLSSVLRSKKAVHVNIQIMRAFGILRELLLTHKDLAQKLETLEQKYDHQFRAIFDAIREIMSEREVPKKQILGLGKSDCL
ncbi:ORF6N domain-containing protein [Bdellovibrionota bacterium FG-2]